MGEGGSLMGGGIGSAGWRKKDGANGFISNCISRVMPLRCEMKFKGSRRHSRVEWQFLKRSLVAFIGPVGFWCKRKLRRLSLHPGASPRCVLHPRRKSLPEMALPDRPADVLEK